MTAKESQQELVKLWQECRKELEDLFYYCEEEDLKKRLPKKGSWSITEVLFHINLVNGHYLKGMPKPESLASADEGRSLKRSFIGKQLEKSMRLKSDGSMKMKLKSPSVSDPIKAQKRGHAAVEKVIFREVLTDLDQIKSYIDLVADKKLEAAKVPSLLPILKLNAADVLFVTLVHELRHLAQARRILEA